MDHHPHTARARRGATRDRALLAVALGALIVGVAAPARADAIKDSQKCHGALGKAFAKVAQTGTKVSDKCHKTEEEICDASSNRAACNDTGNAAFDPKTKYTDVKTGSAGKITDKCLPLDLVRGNYPGNDPVGIVLPLIDESVEGNSVLLLGDDDLLCDKPKVKCLQTIAKARTAIIKEITKESVKCQKGLDDANMTGPFGALDPTCVSQASEATAKYQLKLTDTCAGIDGNDIGSCEPLPGCVLDSAKTAGQKLAADFYQVSPNPAVCGNSMVESPEQCDDGNTMDGDGCNSLCESETHTCNPSTACQGGANAGAFCTTGSECPGGSCSLSTCHGGVNAGALCTAGSECPGGSCSLGTRTFKVAITTSQTLSGVQIDFDYPQFEAGIPGFGGSTVVENRLTTLQSSQLTGINDRDTDATVALINVSSGFTSGDLFQVVFDNCGALNQSVCNRAQNVTGCCNNASDPNQFVPPGTETCAKKRCATYQACYLGSNNGTACTQDSDCGKTCVAGVNATNACTTDSECPASRCAGSCAQPSCTTDANCNNVAGDCQGVLCAAQLDICIGDGTDAEPQYGVCVFKCPANPPVCAPGHFDFNNITRCDNVTGACPGDNVCVPQTSVHGCNVTSPVDLQGQPVSGVTCSITLTEAP